MRYIDEFRNKNLAKSLAVKIKEIMPQDKINLMEVCGTHTQGFQRFALDKLLPANLKLIAGPGCPVCVSPLEYIDAAVALAKKKALSIATFGDLLRIPGTSSTLEKERANSADIRVLYSPLDALKVARQNPKEKIVFLAVGFETTAPAIGLSIILAKREKINNLFFYTSLKLIPPAMSYLVKDQRLKLDGFLCPGHVSAIIGTRPYEFIPQHYGIPCCVAGFEPVDILAGIYLLLKQIVNKRAKVENQYLRAVTKEGNPKAKKIIAEVFKISDVLWRGLGRIPKSGLEIRKEFSQFDAQKVFSLKQAKGEMSKRTMPCLCAEILQGLKIPLDCPLFTRICNPDHPIGPCMVSSEGACNAYYKYR